MQIRGNISQIKPDYGKLAFINIENAGMGGIRIWLHTGFCPTYLLRDSNKNYHLIQFDNQEWADEWLEEYGKNYKDITRLER